MSWWKKLLGKRQAANDSTALASPDAADLPDFAAFPNPGTGATVQIAFTSQRRSWSEALDLVELLAPILADQGMRCVRRDDTLAADDGLAFAPQVVSIVPLDDGRGAKVSTTIAVAHASLGTVFEWQHSQGETAAEAVAEGFRQWALCDLPTVREATRARDLALTTLNLTTRRDRRRRVVLGPVIALAADDVVDSEHGLACPCCLLTNSLAALRAVVEADGCYALRLYVARLPDGAVVADCRINGADFPAGAAALCDFARTWPGDGVSTRKQYVIVQDAPADDAG